MQPETNLEPAAATPRKTRRNWFAIAGVASLLALGGGVVAAQSFGPPGFGPHGMMMRGPGAMDPAMMAEMADRGIRHLAVEVDATAEQTEKLRAIGRDLLKDLAPLRGARQEAAIQIRGLLTQTSIDRAAIEKFRADQVTKLDGASKRVAQAVADAADVLTPEQRTKLANRMPQPGAGPFWRR